MNLKKEIENILYEECDLENSQYEKVSNRIIKLINKPVETTNEQPKTFTFEEIYNIETALKKNFGDKNYIESIIQRLLKV